MKYCKKCGVLYTTDVCPNCGIVAPEQQETGQAPADQKTVRRQWIGLLIGIPAFILVIMAVIYLFQSITK